MNGRCLKEEILLITLCLIEELLNARPLTAASSDVNDLESLTPNYILLGRSTVSCWLNSNQWTFSSARVSCSMLHWIGLAPLGKRIWSTVANQVQVVSDSTVPISNDSLVWLVDDSSPKGQYPLGGVVKLNIPDDGMARFDTIKTSSCLFTRPVGRLVPLP